MKTLKRVLCVEDDPDLQFIIALSLETAGFEIQMASSGFEALEKLTSFHPQLILMDVMMPGMDGLTTLEKIRQPPIESNVPVIFFTAKLQPDEIERYKAAGVLGVIGKPFDPLKLILEIQRIWEARNQV